MKPKATNNTDTMTAEETEKLELQRLTEKLDGTAYERYEEYIFQYYSRPEFLF